MHSWSGLPLACPECRGVVGAVRDRLVCERDHLVGRLVDGMPDFTRPRSGVEEQLVAFWSSSEAYYEASQRMNRAYDDAGHGSHRVLIDALARAASRRVLDVGCGTGEIALALAERCAPLEYVGVDVSTLAPRLALELGRPGRFLAADAERLPFADASFDAVTSLYALEHFTRPEECLAQMARVLRPGGILGLLSPAYDRPWATVPSIRFGLARRGRELPRWHPANLAVYALRRSRFAARQALKQLRYALDPSYVSFEIVRAPLLLEQPWQSDLDAVHLVSGRSVLRLLERLGLEILDTSLPRGPLAAFRIPWDFRVVARKAVC